MPWVIQTRRKSVGNFDESWVYTMATTDPIRNKKHVRELAGYYLKRGSLRNYLLVVLGVYTALRISDLLRLTCGDVFDFDAGVFRHHIEVVERKTGKAKMIALNAKAIEALQIYFVAAKPYAGDYLFPSGKRKGTSIGRIQAWRIVKTAAISIGLSQRIACHSLRKTFGYHAWKAGASAVLLMNIYNHTDFSVTQRYLGITQDELDGVYLGLVVL